jgi:methyl-accepting chemotaxis protein
MIPESSLDAPIRALTIRIGLLTGTVILLAILAGALISRDIVRAARVIAEAAASMSGVAGRLAASASRATMGAEQVAAAMRQTTLSVDQLKRAAGTVLTRGEHVRKDAATSVGTSDAGTQSIAAAVQAMHRIRDRTSHVGGRTAELSDQAVVLGDINSMVGDIAEQLHLLSLNAELEAVRAGAHGMAFGEVAREVKALAARSKDATVDVRRLLAKIVRATQGVVGAAEAADQTVDTGGARLDEAAGSIRLLAENVREAAHAASEIAQSARQQSVEIAQIAAAMTQVETASASNAASARETEAAAAELNALGIKLQEVAFRYRV